MASIIDKVKDVFTGGSQNTDQTSETTTGIKTGAGDNTYTTGTTGDNHYTSSTTGTSEDVAGPHSSHVANATDPRVDSNLDGSRGINTTTSMTGTTGASYTTGTTGTTGTNYTNSTRSTSGENYTSGTSGIAGDPTYHTDTTGTTGITGQGPHSSSLLNKVDPRVDSTTGATNGGAGLTGNNNYAADNSYSSNATGTTRTTGQGPHSSSLMNTLDPRVDSSTGAMNTSGFAGIGTTGNTAEGNQTYSGTNTRDPFNAAHVPPSVLRGSVGDPVIAHDKPEHNHQGRHASLSHQEAHLRQGSEDLRAP